MGIRELSGIGKSKDNVIETVTVNDVELKSRKDISNAFVDYFSSVADSLERNLCPDDGTSPLVNVQPVQNSFVLYHVSTDECITIISNLKSTSCGLDHPSSNTLKRIKEIVAEPLSFLINKSFDCGIFPSKFKEATITPISVELSQSTSVDCTTTLRLDTSRFGTVSSRHTHVNDRQILYSLLILKLLILCSRYIRP